jgi:hypothetical protein
MDHTVNPTPAPINASVTLPRVLLKNEVGELGVAAGACCRASAGRAVESRLRLAGDKRVNVAPDFETVTSPAMHGTAAALSVTTTLSAMAAVRLINLTCTSSISAAKFIRECARMRTSVRQ